MDFARVSFGETIAGVSGFLLLLFMFLPWFGYSAELGGVASVDSVNGNFWEVSSFLDVLLFLVGLIAVGAALAQAAGAMPANLPAPAGLIVLGAGALAVLIVLFRLLVPPDGGIDEIDVSRKIGVFLGLIAAAGVTFGGYTAMNERAAGAGPRGARPPGA
jgi:hypothetical protein